MNFKIKTNVFHGLINVEIKIKVVGPLEIHYKGRVSITDALVLPGDLEPLLGSIPMEELEVVVHPARQTLEPAHPEGQMLLLK